MAKLTKITTFLWFDNKAEEAVAYYLSIFADAKAGPVMRCGDGGPGPKAAPWPRASNSRA